MPLYNYKCLSCNQEFTELRKISHIDSPIDCPSCHANNTKRLMTAFSVGSMKPSANSKECSSAPSCPNAGGFG